MIPEMPLPEGVDWYVQRILVSERYKDTQRDVDEYLSIDDLFDRHAVLDIIEAHESFANARK